jgi:hypothetical protein
VCLDSGKGSEATNVALSSTASIYSLKFADTRQAEVNHHLICERLIQAIKQLLKRQRLKRECGPGLS